MLTWQQLIGISPGNSLLTEKCRTWHSNMYSEYNSQFMHRGSRVLRTDESLDQPARTPELQYHQQRLRWYVVLYSYLRHSKYSVYPSLWSLTANEYSSMNSFSRLQCNPPQYAVGIHNQACTRLALPALLQCQWQPAGVMAVSVGKG